MFRSIPIFDQGILRVQINLAFVPLFINKVHTILFSGSGSVSFSWRKGKRKILYVWYFLENWLFSLFPLLVFFSLLSCCLGVRDDFWLPPRFELLPPELSPSSSFSKNGWSLQPLRGVIPFNDIRSANMGCGGKKKGEKRNKYLEARVDFDQTSGWELIEFGPHFSPSYLFSPICHANLQAWFSEPSKLWKSGQGSPHYWCVTWRSPSVGEIGNLEFSESDESPPLNHQSQH